MKNQIDKFGRIMALAVLASLSMDLDAQAALRTWTAINGQTIEAEYVRHAAGKIVLKKADGKEIAISPNKLSKADRTFTNKQIRPKLKLEFARKTETRAHNYEETIKKMDCVVKIVKTSKLPYSGKLKVEIFVLGEELSDETITMLHTQTWPSVTLPEKRGAVLELKVDKIKLDYNDNGYKHGEDYYGYAVFVSDDSGNVFASKASEKKLLEKLRDLRKEDLEDL